MKNDKQNFIIDSKPFNFLLCVFVLYVILYFYKLGNIGLIDVDEPRYAEAGREILESSNWIVPYFNYVPRYDKPILFYWLEAMSMTLFGVTEFAARLPSAISGILCAGILFYFVRNFYGVCTALISSTILLSSFEFIALSRFSVTDMTLAFFISSSIMSFFIGYHNIITSHRFFKEQISEFSIWYIIGFIFLALGVLTKGPVAIVINLLVFLPFFWWNRKLEYFYKSKSFWIGLLFFLILIFPWYFAVHIATNGDFTKIFFGLHNFSRYTQIVSGHKGSIFYFFPVVIIGFLPWSFFLPFAINNVLKTRPKSLMGSTKEQLLWFILWWFLAIFLFFSLSRTKLLTYILPLFPAMSMLVGFWLDEIVRKNKPKTGLVISLGIFFLFSLIICYLCLFKLNILLTRELKGLKLDLQIMFFAFLILIGVCMAWASSHKDEVMTICIILSTFLIFYFCLIEFFLPKVDKHSQYLLRTFAKTIPKNIELATYQIIKPSLIFYSKRQVQKLDSLEEISNKLQSEDKFAFVTKKKLIAKFLFDKRFYWGEDNKYIFYKNF